MNFRKIFNKILNEETDTLFTCLGYTFIILGREGSIPHLHFCLNGDINNSDCLALLYKGYANHGKHKLILDKKTLFVVETWLSITENWKEACQDWNSDELNKIKITSNKNPYYIEENNKNDRIKRYLQNRNLDYNIVRKLVKQV